MADRATPIWPTLAKVVKDPRRIGRLRSAESRAAVGRTVRRRLTYLLRKPRVGSWNPAGTGLRRKDYRSYDEYLDAQKSKLEMLNLDAYDQAFRPALRDRLAQLPVDWVGQTVLCLAARKGSEVRAFHELGAFAVGIDLNPGDDNRWVLPGDFHDLQFPDGCIDVVYSNSLDHAFDLPKLLGEIRRVLRPDGVARLEVMHGEAEGGHFGRWEATSWPTVEALAETIEAEGFEVREGLHFDVPWPGTQLEARPRAGAAPATAG